MKKILFAFSIVSFLCFFAVVSVFASYNYSNFPTIAYSFGSSQTYTYYRSTGEAVYDGAYTKGTKFLSIVTKKTSNTLSVKAVPYYYNYCIVTVGNDSYYDYEESGDPTQVNQETVITATINTSGAANLMRYDFDIFQLNGYQYINTRSYDYFVFNNSSGQQVIEIIGD